MADNGSAGLNRGRTFKMKKPAPIGVVFSEHINMWIVRVLKNGTPTTMGKFNTKEEAEQYYERVMAV